MKQVHTAPRPNGHPLPEPIPIDRIRNKVASFHEKMNWIADFMEKYKDEVPEQMRIKKEDLKLSFFIDRRAVARLMRICMRPDFTQLAVYFGLQAAGGDLLKEDSKEFGQMTGIFVGVNENLEMLDIHFPLRPLKTEGDEHIEGEDTWPPPPPPPGKGARPGNGLKTVATENFFSLGTAIKEIREYFAD